MLDEQYFSNEKYFDYMNENYVVFRAAAENDSHQEIYDKYAAFTETIVFAEPDGRETDRIAGYSEPDDFKNRLHDALTGEESFEKLLNAYKSDKNNFDINAKLALKYTATFDWEKADEFSRKVLKQPKKAKKNRITYRFDKPYKITSYELAKGIITFSDPEAALDFVEEFPGSKVTQRVYRLLSQQLNNNEKAVKVTKKLLKKFPAEAALNSAYMGYLTSNEKFEEALKYSEELYAMPEIRKNGGMVANYITLLAGAGKTDKITKITDDYLAYNSEDNMFYQNAYYAFHDNGLYKEAFDLLEMGIKSMPGQIYFYYAYGRTASVAKSHFGPAEKYLKIFAKRALTAEGDNAQFKTPNWQAAAYWRLGLIYEGQGDKEKAVSAYEDGLKHDPEYESLLEAYRKIKG